MDRPGCPVDRRGLEPRVYRDLRPIILQMQSNAMVPGSQHNLLKFLSSGPESLQIWCLSHSDEWTINEPPWRHPPKAQFIWSPRFTTFSQWQRQSCHQYKVSPQRKVESPAFPRECIMTLLKQLWVIHTVLISACVCEGNHRGLYNPFPEYEYALYSQKPQDMWARDTAMSSPNPVSFSSWALHF